jgi:uncharacterized membrane protein YidH (DUF202 family)
MSTLPERWVRLYTLGLPADLRDARRAEIASDVFEHRADRDAPDRALRLELAGRTLRGAVGDLLWRYEERRAMSSHRRNDAGRPTGLHAAWATVTQAWFTPIAVLVALFDLLMAVGIAFDENSKMPGQLIGPVLMVLLAIGLLTGLWLRWRSQFDDAALSTRDTPNPRRNVFTTRALAVLGVVAIIAGGAVSLMLVVVGVLTLVLVGLLAFRRRRDADEGVQPVPRRRTSPVLADVLIIVGTLPALALWWMIVPAVLALVVIGGVLGTGPGLRRAPAT